jgi:hypothetical protein
MSRKGDIGVLLTSTVFLKTFAKDVTTNSILER